MSGEDGAFKGERRFGWFAGFLSHSRVLSTHLLNRHRRKTARGPRVGPADCRREKKWQNC